MNSSLHTTSSTPREKLAGILRQSNKAGELITSDDFHPILDAVELTSCSGRKIFTGQDMIVGRDSSRWLDLVLDDTLQLMLTHTSQWTIHDPFVSQKHLRIYTIVYDGGDPTDVPPLVYAQDLSRNGTYWNGSLIGKGNGGFLLSPGDSLRLSSSTLLCFELGEVEYKASFDLTQENEMKVFRKKYTVTDRLLGAGQWGKVYMAIDQSQRRQLACKVVDLRRLRLYTNQRITGEEQPAQAEDVDNRVQMRKLAALADEKKKRHLLEDNLARWYREIDILASIAHPNVVGIEKAFVTDNTLYIFQDLVTAGDLFSYVEMKNGRLIENETAHIVRQIVIAVKFLHERNIVHRAIKPENILMTTLAVGCRVILTDFGGARKIANHRQRMTSIEGTLGYNAPEIEIDDSGSRQGYSRAVDLWSIGCLTVVLLTGGSSFRGSRANQYSETLAKDCNLTELRRSSEWSEISARPKDFVGKLLLKESRRLTAEEALQHPWFNNDFLKPDFEDLYKRTIKHWQPSLRKKPIIEFVNAQEVKLLQCSQDVLATERRIQGNRGQSPVEPPYKPFPRRMHQPLFPPRRPSGSQYRMPEEVQAAIREHWSSASSADEFSRSNKRTATKQTLYLQPRKPASKALRSSPSLGHTVSLATAQVSLNASASTLNKREPFVATSTQPNCKKDEIAPSNASPPGSNRPATPRPKARGMSQNLPLRAPSTPISNPGLRLQNSRRRKTDPQPYEASRCLLSSADIFKNAVNVLPVVDEPPVRSRVGSDETDIRVQSPNQSDSVKANSGLKLKTPRSAKLQSTSVSTIKKRRNSIYDLADDEEIEDSDNEPKRHRPMWQTAAQAFGSSRQTWNEKASLGDVESALVPQTPSPNERQSSVYLPRL